MEGRRNTSGKGGRILRGDSKGNEGDGEGRRGFGIERGTREWEKVE